jgi:hypothetical protein
MSDVLSLVRKVHNYYVGQPIAKGSYCTLYEGYCKEDFQPVAVRLISKRRLGQTPHADAILFNEKVLVRLLSHPHICPVLDVIESAAQLFHVMRLYPHGDLAAYLKRASPPRSERLRIFDQLLSSVEYLHSLSLAHVDLKPENVLVNDAFEPQLIDFSFATFCFSPIAGRQCGSVGYVAPEVLALTPFDGRAADIFSLGIFLYFLFAGAVPVEDTRKFRASRLSFRGIDADVAELIAAMVAAAPSDRPTVAAVRAHRVFAEVPQRLPGVKVLDGSSPLAAVGGELLERLADAMEVEAASLGKRLAAVGENREKVLYLLAAHHAAFGGGGERPRGPEPLRFSKSLPVGHGLASSLAPEHCWIREVPGTRAAIVSTIVQHLLERKFVVSMARSGSREFVLNQPGEDLCVSLEVCQGDAPGRSLVVVRGTDIAGAPFIGELQQIIDR